MAERVAFVPDEEMKQTLSEGRDRGQVQPLYALSLLANSLQNNKPLQESLNDALNTPNQEEHQKAFKDAYDFLVEHAQVFGIHEEER